MSRACRGTGFRSREVISREQVIDPEDAQDEQVQRVVDVEEPLHERVEPRIRPAFAVVQRQDRDRQHHGQLKRRIRQVFRQERVAEDAHVEHQPERLLPQMPAVRPEAQHQHRRRAAPVAAETRQADQADQQRLQPCAADALRILHAEHHQPPRQRPDHARLAVPAVVERDVPVPVGQSVPFEDVREMRDQREEKHAERVFVDVPRMEEPLRDEEAHGRHSDAPDDVHQLRLPVQRTPGIDRPRDVVDRHGDDRDQLDRVRIQYLAVLHPALF